MKSEVKTLKDRFKPFRAFAIGVAVNVPVGYFLSTVVFSSFWSNISSLM